MGVISWICTGLDIGVSHSLEVCFLYTNQSILVSLGRGLLFYARTEVWYKFCKYIGSVKWILSYVARSFNHKEFGQIAREGKLSFVLHHGIHLRALYRGVYGRGTLQNNKRELMLRQHTYLAVDTVEIQQPASESKEPIRSKNDMAESSLYSRLGMTSQKI